MKNTATNNLRKGITVNREQLCLILEEVLVEGLAKEYLAKLIKNMFMKLCMPSTEYFN